MIGCVLVPYFAPAVERRDDPSLASAPLVIVQLDRDSRRVFAVSDEAAQLGVAPGMTLHQAQIVCPQARFIPPDQPRYQRVFNEFLEVLARFAPDVEPAGPQPSAIGYLDLPAPPAPLDKTSQVLHVCFNRQSDAALIDRFQSSTTPKPSEVFGSVQNLGRTQLKRAEVIEMAKCIGQTVRGEVGLAPAIGVAGGKFPAYIAATSIEPNKVVIVPPGREATFLAPFSPDLLPLDGETSRRLQLLGIRSLGQLAALPVSALITQFGTQGQSLHCLAQGRDNRPLRPRPPQEMERVLRQFEDPIANRTILEAITSGMAINLAHRLQARGLAARQLRLVLHLEDETSHQAQLVMRQPTSAPSRLTSILGELIAHIQLQRGVSGIDITLADLVPARGQQLDLFIHQSGQRERLCDVLKDMLARYGAGCFYRASLFDQSTPLLERRFRVQELDAP